MSFQQQIFITLFFILCFVGSFSEQKLYPFIPFNMYSEFNPKQIKIVRLKVITNNKIQYIDFRQFFSKTLTENDIFEIMTNMNKREKNKLGHLTQQIKEKLQKENKESISEVKMVTRYFEHDDIKKTTRVRDVELK